MPQQQQSNFPSIVFTYHGSGQIGSVPIDSVREIVVPPFCSVKRIAPPTARIEVVVVVVVVAEIRIFRMPIFHATTRFLHLCLDFQHMHNKHIIASPKILSNNTCISELNIKFSLQHYTIIKHLQSTADKVPKLL